MSKNNFIFAKKINMFSQAEENYLKSIYTLEKEMLCSISTNLIAQKTKTKASSVTDMLKKLDAKKLVVYQKYQGVSLTSKGKKVALKVIRKHRLWEYFLVEKLHYSWDKVHDIAEQLEHIQSETLIDNLDAFLEFPRFDPHGDPIPDKTGNIAIQKAVNILDMKIGDEGVLKSVKDSSASFLNYLDKQKLAIGDTIKILDIEPFDYSVQIKTNSNTLTISKNVAENLFIKYSDAL